MNPVLQGAALAAVFGAATLGAEQTVRSAPIEAYGALPAIDDLQISPDGTKFAYVVLDGGRQAVVVASLDPPAVITGLSATDQKVRGLDWADNDHLLILKSQTGFARDVASDNSEWTLAQVLDLKAHKATSLLSAEPVATTEKARLVNATTHIMNVIAGSPQTRMIDGRPVVFVRGIAFKDNAGVPALFRVDLVRKRQTTVETAVSSDQRRSWIIDANGERLAQVTYDELSQEWILRVRRGDGWFTALTVPAAIDTPWVEGVSPDGSALIVVIPSETGYETKTLSLKDGALTPASESIDDLSSVITDPVTHRIIGGVREDMVSELVLFDPADQAIWNGIVAAFPGEEVELASWSDDRKKVIVRVTGPEHGVSYVLVDAVTKKAQPIGQVYSGIKPEDIAAVQTITYKASDGLVIPAYLTLPNGRDPKKLPLIVLPHGGPSSRDGAGFDWWAQALASRGYAVLQPQFRGSYGLGWTLEAAGFGQWGRKMQTDLSDGVAALGRSEIIDPKRVCIVGGSYGGYAALAGVTLQSGIYRCGASIAGVSDVGKMLGGRSADASRDVSLRHFDRYLGAKNPTDPVMDQVSPVKFASRLSVPLLLIHGEDDTVVPIEQSRRMASALKDAGKSFEFVTLKSEDHWLSRSETRQQMLQATVTFLEKNNPPN